MKTRLGIALAFLLLAVVAWVFWWRAKWEPKDLPNSDRVSEVPSAPGGAAADAADTSPGTSRTQDPPPTPPKLYGLRLISMEAAQERGWTPLAPAPRQPDPLRDAWQSWQETKVDLNFSDETLENILLFLEKEYGLPVRIDPEVSLVEKTITFRVKSLSAYQAIDLMVKCSELGFAIDPAGVAWITTPEQARRIAAPPLPHEDPWHEAATRIRANAGWKPEPEPAAVEPAWKGRKVNLSIANRPLLDALSDLRSALGDQDPIPMMWSAEAHQKAAACLPVSVIGDDIPFEEALARILKDSGFVSQIRPDGTVLFVTEERVAADRKAAEATRKEWEAEGTAEAAFRARRVSILGDVLTAARVAEQLREQLGVTLRMSAEVAACPALWESDGLEQTAGEVLDILARDGALIWRWQGEYAPTSWLPLGERRLWLVGARER